MIIPLMACSWTLVRVVVSEGTTQLVMNMFLAGSWLQREEVQMLKEKEYKCTSPERASTPVLFSS